MKLVFIKGLPAFSIIARKAEMVGYWPPPQILDYHKKTCQGQTL
jgi:hypothetical protein